MEHQTHTFLPSKRVRLTFMFGMGIFLTMLTLVVSLVADPDWGGITSNIYLGVLALIWLFAFPMWWLILTYEQRGLRLHIGPEGVCRQQDAVKQLVPWSEITRLQIRRWGLDKPLTIMVFTAEGPALTLNEFEELGEIARLLEAGIGSEAQVVNS